jgi:hypothetical protein
MFFCSLQGIAQALHTISLKDFFSNHHFSNLNLFFRSSYYILTQSRGGCGHLGAYSKLSL